MKNVEPRQLNSTGDNDMPRDVVTEFRPTTFERIIQRISNLWKLHGQKDEEAVKSSGMLEKEKCHKTMEHSVKLIRAAEVEALNTKADSPLAVIVHLALIADQIRIVSSELYDLGGEEVADSLGLNSLSHTLQHLDNLLCNDAWVLAEAMCDPSEIEPFLKPYVGSMAEGVSYLSEIKGTLESVAA